MKVIKGLLLVCFLGVAVSACFDPPEYSDKPEITVENLQFKRGSTEVFDTLILYLNFRDGNGDLGLDPDINEEPYNDFYYYLADGTGDTLRVLTEVVYQVNPNGNIGYNLVQPGTLTGKLATADTRSQPNYSHLPVYDPSVTCSEEYSFVKLLVAASDAEIIDASYSIIDTITLTSQSTSKYYVVQEPFLYKRNPNHNNIEIRYLVFENGGFVEFNWFEEFCTDFNGRFPDITNELGVPLEGTIRYAMTSSNMLQLFSIKELKLGIRIRDRALHTSTEVFTPQFTLSEVCVNCD